MLNRLLKTKMSENNNDDDNNIIDDYFNLRSRAQSTSHLLSPDSATIKSVSPTPSSTSSTSSLVQGNSPKTNLSSFLKVSSPNHKSNNSPPSPENGLLMTIIRSPSTNSQRIPSNEATVINEELSNNNKFFKSKMTAALNHMKYRKFKNLFIL